MRTGICIEVTLRDRDWLLVVAAKRTNPQKHVQRARIALLTADGHRTSAIIREVGVARTAV